AVAPADRALAAKPPDYADAEAGFSQAARDFPSSSYVAYQLGKTLLAQQRQSPEKAALAVYQFVRAAAIDPTIGGSADAAGITSYAARIYAQYHGSGNGLSEL